MVQSIFTKKDDVEGNIGLGKIPNEYIPILDNIITEYNKESNEKKDVYLTKHTFYEDMNDNIKINIDKIRNTSFFNQLCDNKKCKVINVPELDELMYSYPPPNLGLDNNMNLYGDTNAFQKHIDCDVCNFEGVKFYRVLIGLTDNKYVTTVFNNFNIDHKIQKNDYMVFDFGKTTHQVITDNTNSSPRLFMKMHFMACDDNCSDFYLWCVKQYHIYYYISMRNLQNETGGRNPSTFKEFFFGLMSHYYYNSYTKYLILFFLIGIILISYKFIKHLKKRIFFIVISFMILYLLIVSFYWLRYILFGVR